MKVVMRCDQGRQYLDKADEIYVPYHRADLIEEIHTQYPNKTILLDNENAEVDINDLKMYSGLCRGQLKFLVGLDIYEDVPLLKRVLCYPMTSLLEMEIAYSHGISEFYIGTELLHQLDKVKKFKERTKCTIRIRANKATEQYGIAMPDELLHLGGYLLPGELQFVEDVIDYIEFVSEDAKQEAAYYRIYFEDGEWPGAIHYLIQDFDSNALVRMMEFRDTRFRCNMACLGGSSCRLCKRNIDLANPELYTHLEKAQE